VKCIIARVTKGIHLPERPRRTKPWLGGPRRWPTCPTLTGWHHFDAKSSLPWRVRMLRGGGGGTDLVRSIWPRTKAGRPRGSHSAMFHHGNTAAKSGNRLWDAINTPLFSPLEYTRSIVGYPLVKAPVL
jgi:hypothetical protein